MKRAQPEAQLHKAVAAYLRLALKPPTIWTTIGHGGGGKVRGAQLKAMGVMPGWPDIIILWMDHDEQTRVTGIELKAGKGKLSDEQELRSEEFADVGADYVVARSVDDVQAILEHTSIIIHARV